MAELIVRLTCMAAQPVAVAFSIVGSCRYWSEGDAATPLLIGLIIWTLAGIGLDSLRLIEKRRVAR